MAKKTLRDRDYVLDVKVLFGNGKNFPHSEDFHIRFVAKHFFHAKRVAAGRLKAFVKRRMEYYGMKHFSLSNPVLISERGNNSAHVPPRLRNNSFLYEKHSNMMFVQKRHFF